MLKQLYQFISEQLLAITDTNGKAVIRHINLWNNQLLYAEEEQPFATPAIFIEYQPLTWVHMGGTVGDTIAEVTLHVITDSRTGAWADVTDTLALLDQINRTLYGAHNQSGINPLTATATTIDSDFAELMHNTVSYQCHLVDTACAPAAPTATVKTLRITT